VQDLERQLMLVRQQNERLRSAAGGDAQPDPDHKRPNLPLALDTDLAPSKRRRLTNRLDFAAVRQGLEEYGHGLVALPTSATSAGRAPAGPTALPELPPQSTADRLVLEYQQSFHALFPIMQLPSFRLECDAIYRNAALAAPPPTWIAILFAVFACGSLGGSVEEGKKMVEISRSYLDTWTDGPTVDHVRAALLQGLFLVESNSRPTAWVVIGYAARVAQDLGLHRRTGHRSSADEDIRRRLWWSVFLAERSVCRPPWRPLADGA
jgi:hypothetical protein